MMVARWDNIGNRSWRSLYQVRTSSFLMAVCEDAALQKTLNYESDLYLRILLTLEAVIGPHTVSLSKQSKLFAVVTAGGVV